MAAKTVLNYLDRDSVVHKMTGTTKLAFFLLFTFASMIIPGCCWDCLQSALLHLNSVRSNTVKFGL